jgi:hypothetical protein
MTDKTTVEVRTVGELKAALSRYADNCVLRINVNNHQHTSAAHYGSFEVRPGTSVHEWTHNIGQPPVSFDVCFITNGGTEK